MAHIRAGLAQAMEELSVRGLKLAAKWAGEQLLGMSDVNDPDTDDAIDQLIPVHGQSDQVPQREKAFIQFANLLLTTGEYQRCAHFLRTHRANNAIKSNLGLFLNAYSLYLAGEKLKAQAIAEGATENTSRVNPFLTELFQDLTVLYQSGRMDGHLLYIYGVVMRDYTTQYGSAARNAKSTSNAHARPQSQAPHTQQQQAYVQFSSPYDVLFESVRMYPYNWSAWLELANGYISSSNTNSTDASYGAPSPGMSVEGSSLPVFPKWIMDIMKKLYSMPGGGGGGKEGGDRGSATEESEHSDAGQMDLESESAPHTYSTAEGGGEVEKEAHNLSAHEVMVALFVMHVCIEKQKNHEATLLLEHVGMPLFPTSQAMLSMIALTFYGRRDFEKARTVFEKIQQLNPYRLENLDTFSNILYVMECKAELSHLAHQCVKVDKFRSETCCIVGNYYSLKGQHEKSIIQFQRALKVNFRCLSAWTLMGHEYVELHKTSAAVHCYRKAIEMNSADYRAWYGLGQTYEMLHLHQYALYYFRKAASLRPADSRMWNAVGTCLSRLGNSSGSREVSWRSKTEAIEAYERAVHCEDAEGLATRELARLHREMGNTTKAAHYYLFHVQSRDKSLLPSHPGGVGGKGGGEEEEEGGVVFSEDSSEGVDVDLAEGLLFVASYYFDKNEMSLAEKYCMRLIHFRGPEGAEAKSILREIRSFAKANKSVADDINDPIDTSRSYHNNSSILGHGEQDVNEDVDEQDPSGTTFNLMDSNDSIHDAFI